MYIKKAAVYLQPFFMFHPFITNTLFPMLQFNDILKNVEKGISELEFNAPPQSLYKPIKYILSLGGKRIRPALTLMTYNIYKSDIETALPSALGLEIFHNFTLLHDDLMDNADKRRNKPTVHKVWNDNTAILSGDAMLIVAYQLIAQTPSAYLKEVLNLFTQTALEICGGQQYDMEFETRMDVSEEEYIEMIRLKTAVLLACALKTGAIIAGAPSKDTDALYEFGINIGLAFQLQDDLLDVYGDTKTFGKNIGGDILCNKKTYLLINALKKAPKKELKTLNEWLTKTSYEPNEKIKAITDIYNSLQLKKQTEEKIQDFYTKAMLQLTTLSVSSDRLIVLKEVSDQLMHRNV